MVLNLCQPTVAAGRDGVTQLRRFDFVTGKPWPGVPGLGDAATRTAQGQADGDAGAWRTAGALRSLAAEWPGAISDFARLSGGRAGVLWQHR